MHAPVFFIGLLALLAAAGVSSSAERPDVLFIAVDDLNDWTGHLGGHPQARTPNIDRLVARGVTFANAHCAVPACNPSRASLMSGLRPWRTGIYANDDPAGKVLRDTVTLNRHFLAHGYRTLGGGKIYHVGASEGRDDTWTEWKGLFPGAKAGGKAANLNGLGRDQFDWGPVAVAASDLPDAKLTDWAVAQLRTAPSDQPLFLAVGYVKPHLPWHVPQEFFDRFPLESIQLPEVREDDLADVPEAGRKMAKPEGDHAAVVASGQWKQAVRAYLATVSFLDDEVGRLLEGLESSPRADRTIVVWWTDHGWHLGEKQHWRKFALWEEATRTSFAIAAPGVTAPGGRCAAPVDYTSVFPTLCELAGLPVPDHAAGPSLVPWLRDPTVPSPGVAICTHGRGNHAVRDGRWRYIRYADGTEELYDHESDPREWENVAGGAEAGPVKARLAAWLPAAEDEVPRTGQDRNPGKR